MMRGLFLNNFYNTLANIKLFLVLICGTGIWLFIKGDSTALEIFVYVSITALSVSGISVMRRDSTTKWDKYEITLPISRGDIVKCKFASYLFWVVLGGFLAAIVMSIAIMIHGNIFYNELRELFSLFSLGVGIAVMTGAVFFILVFLFGSDKSETLLIVSVLAAVGLAIFLIWLVNSNDWNNTLRLSIFNLLYLSMYLFSYLLSTRLYIKKEF